MKCLPKEYDVENAEKDSGLLNGTSEGEPLQLGSLEDYGLKIILEIVNELSYESVAMGQINISWPKNKDDLRNRTIELQEEFKNHYVEPGLYLKARALSGALMMTDTYIASLSRGGKPSSYGKEVNLFLRKLCDP